MLRPSYLTIQSDKWWQSLEFQVICVRVDSYLTYVRMMVIADYNLDVGLSAPMLNVRLFTFTALVQSQKID